MQDGLAIAGVAPGEQQAAKEASDLELIQRIADHDEGAMRVLFARHRVRVFRFVAGMVGNQETAEEVVSDVFLEVWRKADQFEARSRVTTWILGIARHKALGALRRRSIVTDDEDALAFVEDPADNPEVAVQKTERSELLRDCIKQLSPAHREIIDLVYYHERSIGEVASIIGVPVNTVKTRMFYARKRLEGLLAARGIEPACS